MTDVEDATDTCVEATDFVTRLRLSDGEDTVVDAEEAVDTFVGILFTCLRLSETPCPLG